MGNAAACIAHCKRLRWLLSLFAFILMVFHNIMNIKKSRTFFMSWTFYEILLYNSYFLMTFVVVPLALRTM